MNVGVSAASTSLVDSVPVVARTPSSATAPEEVPVITGASSDPVTVTVTDCVSLSPWAGVAVRGTVSVANSPPGRL